jgi:acetylornithine deacetylase/succinyl-diaminopimelate desuccinylase-like protein
VQGAEGTNPLVLGRLGNDPAKPTLAYYGHYDVVPAVAEEGWDSDPFAMDGRDGYLYSPPPHPKERHACAASVR